MVSKSFKDVFKNIDRSINGAKKAAAKRAATTARTKLVREVREDIGLESAKIKKRIKQYKADEQGVVISVGILRFFPAHDFKPKKIKVNTARGVRYGATFLVKNLGRQIAIGGFLAKGKRSGKDIIIQRKTESRYPTATVMVDVFTGAVLRAKPMAERAMVESFEKNLRSEIAYRLSR